MHLLQEPDILVVIFELNGNPFQHWFPLSHHWVVVNQLNVLVDVQIRDKVSLKHI